MRNCDWRLVQRAGFTESDQIGETGWLLISADNRLVARVRDEEDGRRILACVTACRHLGNAALEDGVVESALALLAEGAGRVEALQQGQAAARSMVAWAREARIVLDAADGGD